MLRHRIIVGSVISLLGILLLGSLYARQRQRARIAVLANAANEKEREFLELQKETEQRLTRKYIDGLESERERMATELHDDVCNSLLALEMNIRTISGEESSDLSEQLGLLSNTRERLRTLSHELMPRSTRCWETMCCIWHYRRVCMRSITLQKMSTGI